MSLDRWATFGIADCCMSKMICKLVFYCAGKKEGLGLKEEIGTEVDVGLKAILAAGSKLR